MVTGVVSWCGVLIAQSGVGRVLVLDVCRSTASYHCRVSSWQCPIRPVASVVLLLLGGPLPGAAPVSLAVGSAYGQQLTTATHKRSKFTQSNYISENDGEARQQPHDHGLSIVQHAEMIRFDESISCRVFKSRCSGRGAAVDTRQTVPRVGRNLPTDIVSGSAASLPGMAPSGPY